MTKAYVECNVLGKQKVFARSPSNKGYTTFMMKIRMMTEKILKLLKILLEK